MPYIKLVESSRPGHPATEAHQSPVRIGREPGSTILFSGDVAKVVSTRHAEIRFEGGAWVVADLGSRNGTYLNGRRLAAATPLKTGDVIRLGESGPELRIAAVAAEPEAGETLAEHPVMAAKPAEVRAYGVTLLAAATGRRYEARGTRIRLGRGSECEVQVVEAGETIVSRVHAELTVGPSGASCCATPRARTARTSMESASNGQCPCGWATRSCWGRAGRCSSSRDWAPLP